MIEPDALVRHPLLRVLRPAATLALGVAIGLAVLATFSERTAFDAGPVRLKTLHLTDAWSALWGAVLLRWLLAASSLRALGEVAARAAERVPGRAGRALLGLVLLNLVLLPHSLGHGTAQTIKARRTAWDPGGDLPPPYGSWESTNIDPIIREGRRRIRAHDRVLLLGPGLREFERYLIAYALFPRRVYLHPADEERLTLRHTPFARPPAPENEPPTGADYRIWASRRSIDWVIFRDGEDPADTRMLPLEEAFPE